MQSSVWGMGKDKIACSDVHTFFTSQFFDFNNETSQMEDFDISKQYLNSELSQKSTILRHMSEEYFLQALEVHYKFCLRDSMLFWRNFNSKQKRKDALSPKNMTKVFLKIFYILNKKIRSKIQKSFIKITNFTKQNDMKTYETPNVKGIKRLDQTFEALNSKYCYGNPVYLKKLIQYSFKELKLFTKAVQNKQPLQNFMRLLEKMSNYVAMQQFEDKLLSYQKLIDKIEIFIGTLSLLVNPIKRSCFQRFKECKHPFNFILNELEESIKYSEPQSLTIKFRDTKSKQTIEKTQANYFKKNTDIAPKEIEVCPLEQSLLHKRQSELNADDYFGENQNKLMQENIEAKETLTFSKQLKRKSSSLQKKNKFKFKSIPAGTPKKQPKEAYIEQNLPLKAQVLSSELEYELQPKIKPSNNDLNLIKPHKPRINLKFLKINLKPLEVKTVFQNSLNYATKSRRMITTNEKICFTNYQKPNQLNSTYPDYFDFYTFTDIPFDKKLIEAKKLSSKDESKKGFKIFKTIKSGKSNTNFDQVPNSTPKKQPLNKNPSQKPSFQIPQRLISDCKSQEKKYYQSSQTLKLKMEPFQLIQREKPKPGNNCQQISTQKLINFKSMQKAASKSSLHDLKNQSRFPISYPSNKNTELQASYETSKQKNDYFNEYQTNIYRQPNIDHDLRQNRIQKSYDPIKNSSLTFKTNRPLKKIKSSDKQIVMKKIQGKKQRKGQKNIIKAKTPKQIKSQFIDLKEQAAYWNHNQKLQNTILLTARSGKSVSQKNIKKNNGLKQNMKK